MAHHPEFPTDGEVVRRLEELEDRSKYTAKLLIGLIIGALGTVLSFGIWVGTLQTDSNHNHEMLEAFSADHRSFGARIGAIEIANSDIKARLISIEATLQEIKTSIARLR